MTTVAKSPSLTAEQEASVRKELGSILAGSSFSGSKRCSDFLEYIVKHALTGEYERLTERFLGVELFGRPVDYETATDSVVRVRATDVRHRLVQHYAEHRPAVGVTIELAPGTYIPDFRWNTPAADGSSPRPGAQAPHTELSAAQTPAADRPIPRRIRKGWIFAVTALLVVSGVLAIIPYWRSSSPSPTSMLNRFWQPVFSSKKIVTICFGDTTSYWPSIEARKAPELRNQTLPITVGQLTVTKDDQTTAGNIRAALSIMGVLARHEVNSQLRWPQEVQGSELARTNVVYIGAFSNSWTMSLNRNLRFSFVRIDNANESTWMIRDRNNPNRNWSTTATYPQPIDHDYALITRIIDPEENRVVISVGGLNQFGTQAAGEFLADEASLSSFARIAPKGWEQRNIQIVLEMEVSGRRAVNPRILATEVW